MSVSSRLTTTSNTQLRLIPDFGSVTTTTTPEIIMTTATAIATADVLLSNTFSSILTIATDISQQLHPTSPEPIHTAFTVATFLPQPFWLLMILLPNNKVTKSIMGGLEIPLLCCLIHFFGRELDSIYHKNRIANGRK